jgi:release factor glutamine methyltransferase
VSAATTSGSVREALEAAESALAAVGIETARLDARLLLEEATGLPGARLVSGPEDGIEPSAARRFGALVRRRVRREPIAYILGRKGFRRIELAVDARALVPRPETELLVEVALDLRPERVLDVGTGSGAVALAIADELSSAEVVATDTSPDALRLARENAERLGLSDRVRFEDGTLPREPGGLELLVANLPYVAAREWPALQPEITRYEPRGALVAGPTGLEAIARLLADLGGEHAAPRAIALEVGAGQADAVAGLVAGAGYESVETRRDLAGIDRVVLGRR